MGHNEWQKNKKIFLVFILILLISFTTLSLSKPVLSYVDWQLTEVISSDSSQRSSNPEIAIDAAGNVHIVWYDDPIQHPSDRDVYYRLWNRNYQNWTATELLSTISIYDSDHPSITVDNKSNVHVAWSDRTDYLGAGDDRDIFYRCWNASITSWSSIEVVSTESVNASYSLSIDTDNAGNVHIAWYDKSDYAGAGEDMDVFYKFRNKTSSSWNLTEVVSTESTSDSYWVSLAVCESDNVHIVWSDETDYLGAGSDADIFYKFFNKTSSSWNLTEVVSITSSGTAWHPSLGIDSENNIHIAWMDAVSVIYDIYYKLWNSTQQRWETSIMVSSESTGYSVAPALAVDESGNIHIVWHDETNIAGSDFDYDIFYKRWNSSTDRWSTTEVVSTESRDGSFYSCIAVDSTGTVHVAWHDFSNYAECGDDYDIFYKKGTEGIPVIDEYSLSPIVISVSNIVCLGLMRRRQKKYPSRNLPLF